MKTLTASFSETHQGRHWNLLHISEQHILQMSPRSDRQCGQDWIRLANQQITEKSLSIVISATCSDIWDASRPSHTSWGMLKSTILINIKLRSSKAGTVYSCEVEDQMSLFDRKRSNVRTLLYRLSKKNQPKVNSVYKRKMSYKR